MRFQLSGDGPIYGQIIEQIRGAIALGRLAPGTRLPTVRALAAELGVNANTIAHAYAGLERAGVLVSHAGRGTFVAPNERLTGERRARVQAILGRSVVEALSLGYSVAEVEAAFGLGLARWRREADDSPPVAAPTGRLVLAGSHDLVLDLLAARLARHGADRLELCTVGSLAGLIALVRNEAHLAGCHLLDAETGDYNLPFVRRLLPGRRIVVVRLAGREQGLILRTGNPKGVEGVADLVRPDVTFVNRQPGSGTRVLLDHHITRAGLPSAAIRGYSREETTHLRVAAAVAEGEVDVGLGILAAARAFGLDFLPLWHEQYDLVIPREHVALASVGTVLEVLRDPDFRRVVEELGGYDVAEMGVIVSET